MGRTVAKTASRTGAAVRGLAFGLGLMAMTGCTPIYRNHGFMPTAEVLNAVSVGVDTRETVAENVGTPTAGGVLDASGYYYVSSRFRHFGFLEPREVDREVLAISFDAGGVVSNIERFGLEDGQVVALSRRVTASGVQDTTFIRQLIGNIGNFNAGTLLGSE